MLNTARVAALIALVALAPNGRASNPIVIENLQVGTRAWELSNPASDDGLEIKGYGSATSVNKGDAIDFYVTVTPPQDFVIDIYRVGWYGGDGGRLITSVGPIAGVQQAPVVVDSDTGLVSAPWSVSYTLSTLSSWTSGVYLAKLTNAAGFENYIVFVVRDDGRAADFIYSQSVMTDQAYNNFPNDGVTGKSLYAYNSFGSPPTEGDGVSPAAVKVSFDRPYDDHGSGLLFNWEHDLILWLEKSGYDVSYSTNVDTHSNGAAILNYSAFFSTGHDEYWTKEMFDALEQARDSGVNLAFFGANVGFIQSRLEPSASDVPNRVLVVYREAELDPEPDVRLKTVKFRNIGRPEQILIGLMFEALNSSAANNTAHIVRNDRHWSHAQTGFRSGDGVPGIIGYEVDAYDPSHPLPSNLDYTLLSSSPFLPNDGEWATANAALYQASSGAWVFASGTMSWSWALNDLSDDADPRIQQMMRNVLQRFLYGDPAQLQFIEVSDQVGLVGEAVSLPMGVGNPDSRTLTYAAAGLPDGLRINDLGVIVGTPSSAGSYSPSITVNDGAGSNIATFNWQIDAPPSAACSELSQEAENALLSGRFAVGSDAAASGGSFIHVPDGTGDAEIGSVHRATLCLSVPSAGGYRLQSWTAAPDSASDSFLFTIDEQPAEGFLWEFSEGDTFDFAYVGAQNLASPLEVYLSAGDHYFTFYPREDGAKLDKLTLEPVGPGGPNTAPTILDPGDQFNTKGDTVNLTLQATDAEGDPFRYSSENLPHGLAVDPDTGLVSGVASNASVYPVKITVSDGRNSESVEVEWAVNTPSNVPPTVTPPANQSDAVGDVVSVAVQASDLDGDSLGYFASRLPHGLSIDSATGVISGTPVSAGLFDATISVTDGIHFSFAPFTWQISGSPGGACASLVQEAESAVLSGNVEVGSDPLASGGEYIHAPEGSGNQGFGTTHQADLCFLVTQAGTYRVKGWAHAISGLSDSFFVTVNGEPAGGALWDTPRNLMYESAVVTDRDTGLLTVDLDVGVQSVVFHVREDGTRLDRASLELVAPAPTATPTVTITVPADGATFVEGDAVSFAGSADDAEDGDLSASLAWTSSIDGAIGSGPSFSLSTLSVGAHLITATVTDSGGVDGSATVSITIDSAPNTTPTASITAPADGATFVEGDAISFAGSADDAEDGDLSASLAWTSSLDGSIGSGPSFSLSTLSVGAHLITATVTDSGGVDGSATVSITIDSAPNTTPTASITAPADGATFVEGDAISFAGSADDAEDGDLSASLAWTSSLDGSIGSGASFSLSTLSVGAHLITATVTDSGGVDGSATVSITIDSAPNTTPTASITAPADGATFVEGDAVSFAGSADDAEDGDLSASLAWTSSLDGAIGSGPSFSLSTLSVGAHLITATVTDSGGVDGSATVSITIDSAPNTTPTASITAPADGATFVEGDAVSFAGSADDAEDGDLSASLAWTSSLDGAIGSGASFSLSTLSVGAHLITATVTDSGGVDGSAAISITIDPVPPPNPIVPNFGSNLATARGTVGDNHADTHVLDGNYQVLTEELQGGNPNRSRSLLEHVWVFDVQPGTSYLFEINAYRTANTEGDHFAFQYSTDNSTYLDMLTVSKVAPDSDLQAFSFSSDVSGAFYVRVQDTDQSRGNNTQDSLFVDYMAVLTVTDGSDVIAPAPPAALVATPGDATVSLDWADNPEPDFAAYFLYRSETSGGPYAVLAGPLVASSFTDGAVTNGTRYFYVATAVDDAGNESDAGNEATATPSAPGEATSIHVASVVTSVVNVGSGQKRGRAVIQVTNNLGEPVAGAIVTGQFSGSISEPAGPAPTGGDGFVTFETANSARGGVEVDFCIDNVVGALPYDPTVNQGDVLSCEP